MTQSKKKISKSRLDPGASQAVTYPRYTVKEQPEREQNAGAIRVTAGDGTSTVVSPVLYSLAFRKAWKKISDEHYNR